MKLKVAVIALFAVGILSGCGEKKVDPAEAEKTQAATASEQSQSPETK